MTHERTDGSRRSCRTKTSVTAKDIFLVILGAEVRNLCGRNHRSWQGNGQDLQSSRRTNGVNNDIIFCKRPGPDLVERGGKVTAGRGELRGEKCKAVTWKARDSGHWRHLQNLFVFLGQVLGVELKGKEFGHRRFVGQKRSKSMSVRRRARVSRPSTREKRGKKGGCMADYLA